MRRKVRICSAGRRRSGFVRLLQLSAVTVCTAMLVGCSFAGTESPLVPADTGSSDQSTPIAAQTEQKSEATPDQDMNHGSQEYNSEVSGSEMNTEPILTPTESMTEDDGPCGIPIDVDISEETPSSVEVVPTQIETSMTNPNPPAAGEKHIVVIDPGHGGGAPGAQYNGVEEKVLTLKVALYAREYLNNNYPDIIVYMTRESDMALAQTQKADLQSRADFAKQMNAEIFVSMHFNATGADVHDSVGSLGLVSKQPWVSDQCNRLATLIQAQLETLGIVNGGLMLRDSETEFDEYGKPMDYYAINRFTASLGIPGIIVEHCYIDNPNEIRFVDSEEDLKAMGEADARGIAQYFGY